MGSDKLEHFQIVLKIFLGSKIRKNSDKILRIDIIFWKKLKNLSLRSE